MNRSLFITPSTPENLPTPPRGPLRRVKPSALFSLDALRRAWIKVRAVGGAAGVDGQTIAHFEQSLADNLQRLQRDLLQGRYRPQSVRRLLAPKANGGWRPLGLWTLRDKIAQRVVYDCIEPYFETHLLACNYGYRTGRGLEQAIQAITRYRQANRRWVADIDIKECFDSLDSTLILKLVRQQVRDRFILRLIKAWLQARVFNDLNGPTAAGASQGAVISPLLANIVLHQVDRRLLKRRHKLVRYADDLVILCQRKAEAEQALQDATAALQRVRLEVNQAKSRVVHFDEGFKFLGVFFVKNKVYRL